MTHDELGKEYKRFFEMSEAGKSFMKSVNQIIEDAHRAAENNAAAARDCTQIAKGVRQVLDHIAMTQMEVKKR